LSSIFKSRKFWLMITDVVVSAAVYFIAKYADPTYAEDALWMIGLLQPVVISVISGIAIEDAALKGSGDYEAPIQ